MKKPAIAGYLGLLLLVWGSSAYSQETADTLFYRSLHYTAGGMGYWYSQANGGLETITGIPYAQLSCQNCHVAGCSRCHLTVTADGPAYTSKAARQQEKCLECHAREASVLKTDREAGRLDVHFAAGMTCMDCHSVRDLHGDGKNYLSMKQQGAMETKCERCHSPGESRSHTVHGGRVACEACHQQHVVSCTNCHFETQVQEGRRIAIPVSGWLFLMNRGDKVTSANMQSFVVKGKKTFLMFAPQHSHSISKKGRPCDACHATQLMQEIQKGTVRLTRLDDGKVQNIKGVIPVAENVEWEMVYQDREQGRWVPLPDAAKPKLHYAGFGEPLTKGQLRSLFEAQKAER